MTINISNGDGACRPKRVIATFRIEEEMYEWIKEDAQKYNISTSKWLYDLVRAHVRDVRGIVK